MNKSLASLLCLVAATLAPAQTINTLGSGAAVTSIDRSANFNALSVNGVPLSDYVEDRLFIGCDGDSWVGEAASSPPFDPFHGANGSDRAFYFPYGGSQGWVLLRTTDGHRMFGVEFMYGNGWTTGQIYGPYPWGNINATIEWQTWRNGQMASSGSTADQWLIPMGSIVGFYDAAGFDRLYLKCTSPNAWDPNYQALAMDHLQVQLNPCAAPLVLNTPAAAEVCDTGAVAFVAEFGGAGEFLYQWQRESPAGSGEFVDLDDGPTSAWDGGFPGIGGVVSGAYTAALQIAADQANGLVLGPEHAIRFRCVATTICGSATTAAAQLSVKSCIACPADFNGDGGVDGADVEAFFTAWEAGDASADVNTDGGIDGADVEVFFTAWELGGC
ncbi:MAG: hypothetical protein JSR77_07215 [Planctomycetes bacterium]|nr:hypothetical protein [Planctomycetota bacterium]